MDTTLDKPIIFTDLDGSLLDHNTYDFSPTVPLLENLKSMGIPVIPTTSKTCAEVQRLRESLDNSDPFIIENGAAIYIPKTSLPKQPDDTEGNGDYWVKTFAAPRERWQTLTQTLRERFADCYTTFTEAGVNGIQAMTGLPRDEAEMASQREYGEPIQWHGSLDQRLKFIEAVNQANGQVLVGGRFMHISGFCDKGKALSWLTDEYEKQYKNEFTSLAIGDSHNDVAMLDAADLALIIRSPGHSPPSLNRESGVTLTHEYGPNGWVEGVTKLLQSVLGQRGSHRGHPPLQTQQH